jgi:hypothetical protein
MWTQTRDHQPQQLAELARSYTMSAETTDALCKPYRKHTGRFGKPRRTELLEGLILRGAAEHVPDT